MRSILYYIAYFGLLLADLLLIHFRPESNWRPVLEPALMVILFLYFKFHYRVKNTDHPRLVQVALSSLLLGGFFLMKSAPLNSFLAGFCFFLIANIAYTLMFYRYADMNLKRVIPFVTVAYIMAIALLYYFYDAFGYYFLPAFFYIFVLLNCLQAAFLRYNMVSPKSYYLVFSGVFLFLIAQVLAGVYYFLIPEAFLVPLVVAIFFISQILIIHGVLSNTPKTEEGSASAIVYAEQAEKEKVKETAS
ncbi:lysoplasmalogenase [Robertkochia sediminum]|uniref:lysoplasmalogenase n=1 Tax=Robertkochia sediminum TaxID=2785326 RepID=UPI0019321230|nr:lysoplasmalogenase [Robertkochia sediminum]MBL7473645.1 lysoplasmalogenase [Robertkochia sediminum]